MHIDQIPTTLEELTEWTDNTGSPGDTIEHIAAGLIEETFEAHTALLRLLVAESSHHAHQAGVLKRHHRGDPGHETPELTPLIAADFAPPIFRFMGEHGDVLWYGCRVRRLGFDSDAFADACSDVLDRIGATPEQFDAAVDAMGEAVDRIHAMLGIDEDRYLELVLAQLHEKLTRRKAAGTIKGGGER